MSVLNKLLDAILRVEHKLDQLMLATHGQSWCWPPMGEDNLCPVCDQPVRYHADIENAVIYRVCGCTHGKQPGIPIGTLAPPSAPIGEAHGNEDTSVGDQSGQVHGGGAAG